MAKIFTKRDLVAAVSKETGISQVDVIKVFNAASKVQKRQLKAGYVVKTQNGAIKVVARKARKGVNPQTGKKISIPACKRPKFVFSADFKKGY